MQTSIATVSLSGGLAEKLEAIAAAGFTGVEIFESDLLSFNGTPKDVARTTAPDKATIALLRGMDPNGVYLRSRQTATS